MPLKSYGTMGVDWEQRVDYDRLRKERLAHTISSIFLKEKKLSEYLYLN